MIGALMRRAAYIRPEALAALAGAAVVVLGVLVLRGHASPREGTRVMATRASTPVGLATDMRSRTGAVKIATDDLIRLSEATHDGAAAARAAVDSIVAGPLKAKLERTLPLVAAAVERRLAGSRSRALLEGWPLGYRVLSYAGTTTRVSIWTLDIGASSALPLATSGYETTTYLLRWLAGRWQIAAASTASGPTPPFARSTSADVDAFARQAASYQGYRYAP